VETGGGGGGGGDDDNYNNKNNVCRATQQQQQHLNGSTDAFTIASVVASISVISPGQCRGQSHARARNRNRTIRTHVRVASVSRVRACCSSCARNASPSVTISSTV